MAQERVLGVTTVEYHFANAALCLSTFGKSVTFQKYSVALSYFCNSK
jgi:hypothetical protein